MGKVMMITVNIDYACTGNRADILNQYNSLTRIYLWLL